MKKKYVCKDGDCVIDILRRSRCRACRLSKCFLAGMKTDTINGPKGPRKETIARNVIKLMTAMENLKRIQEMNKHFFLLTRLHQLKLEQMKKREDENMSF